MSKNSVKKRAKKGSGSKNKGSNFERQIAKTLTKWWGEGEFHRTPASGALHWKEDHRVSGDIVPPEHSTFPFNVECKNRESWKFQDVLTYSGSIPSYWNQCTSDAEQFDKVPMLILKKNFVKPWVIIPQQNVYLYSKLVLLKQSVFRTVFYGKTGNNKFVLGTPLESLICIDKSHILTWYNN